MKVRIGFVSNSSSSSYVVLLPKNFEPNQFVENMTDDEINNISRWDHYTREQVEIALNELWYEGTIYAEDDNYTNLNICSSVLKDFIIMTLNSGPEEGQISIVSDTGRQKIKHLLETEIRYDKLKNLSEKNG